MTQTVPLKTISIATADRPQASRGAEIGTVRLAPTADAELRAGDILIERTEALLAPSLLLSNVSPLSGWAVVANATPILEKKMRDAGWILFFIAGQISATAMGFDPSKAIHAAATRLAGQAKAGRCNGLEITQIRRRRFLGISWVFISAHVRHLQQGTVLLGC